MTSQSFRIKNFDIFILTLILLGAFFVRIYNLSNLPQGLFCDEASIGYNAYTLVASGTDEYGKKMPIFFEAFGEYKNPIQVYSTTIPVLIFGLNEFSVRVTSVIYGLGSLIVFYFLLKEIFRASAYKKNIALLGTFFLAITPWHLHFSRVSLEGIMAFVFFTTLGVLFFLKSQQKPIYLLFAAGMLTISMYAYFPARLFVPFFGIFIAILYHKFLLKNKKYTFFALLILILLLLPLVFHLFLQDGFARWRQVSIFYNQSQNVNSTIHIMTNYFLHFSPDFLFLKGDSGMKDNLINRHSVMGFGELYVFELPLLFLGIYYLFRQNKKICILLLGWLLLYPLGSMFTTDLNPQATRSIIGVIPFTILSCAGVLCVIKKFDPTLRRRAAFILGITVMVALCYFYAYFRTYTIIYPTFSSGFWGWQSGPRDVVNYFLEHKNNYEQMIMMGSLNQPEIFIKFYDPKMACQSKCIVGNMNQYNSQVRQLFAVSTDRMGEIKDETFLTKKIIFYPNQQPAFYIGEVRKAQDE